ncbi:MAG TPA: alpha/beta fold hydrolase [Anaerolineae bacterium]|nr:alpha/beta fold hydrolase [Anaerolineae bacterium]
MAGSVAHSEPSTAKANGIEIVYDTFGEPIAPALLLIMGLGAQMVSWDEDFCRELAGRDYYVIRFDNRDVGLSTKFDEAGIPNTLALLQAQMQGEPVQAPYTLRDMADDAAGLLDALGIEAAHVVGASMGGMIAQAMAIHHPDRVRTLTSIMSSTGNPDLPPPTAEALEILLKPAPTDRDGYLESAVQSWQVLGGPGFPVDEDRIRTRAGRAFDRGLHPEGTARQMAAVLASGSRKEALRSVTVPTLVIHGDADPLVPVEGGIDTADAVPGAELLIVEGMGHDLPPALWPRMIDAIARHAV